MKNNRKDDVAMTGTQAAYTTKEMAALFGITMRGVNDRAKRENWLFRALEGRGGGH